MNKQHPTLSLPSIPELPDPFLKPDGSRVLSPAEWPAQRSYLKQLLTEYLYGEMPPAPQDLSAELLFTRPGYSDRAVLETVRIRFAGGLSFDVDIIRPNREGRVPVITWNQFRGMHGSPVEEETVLARGYAIVEFDREQLARDSAEALEGPLAKAFPGYGWGAIAMWAYMQSRVVDYLETTDWADMDRLVATGHSRGGKVALCAAIYDDRFALCAPNGSGCGGAGCFRFLGGRLGEGTGLCETAGSICDVFPFWWADRFAQFGLRQLRHSRDDCLQSNELPGASSRLEEEQLGRTLHEDRLPFDLHTAKALIAPRALITTDALSDTWANPYGTQITWRAAQEVYDFLGVPERNAMHLRDGGHLFSKTDWLALLNFADTLFFDQPHHPDITRFPPQGSEQPGKLAQFQDWRNERRHYGWRRPDPNHFMKISEIL